LGVHIDKKEKEVINNILIIAKFVINKVRKLKATNYKLCFELEWNLRKHMIFNNVKEDSNDPSIRFL